MICLKKKLQRLINRTSKKGRDHDPRPLADVVRPPVQRLPLTHQAAALSLIDRQLVKSPTHIKRQHRHSYYGNHPLIVDFQRSLVDELELRAMPFYTHCLLRSHAQQANLYAKGVTRAKPGSSPHNYGMACDIVHSGKHWDLTDLQWQVIGRIGKEVARKRNIKIRWGGDWNMNNVHVKSDPSETFWDPAHWELADWKQRVQTGQHLIAWTSEQYSAAQVTRMSRKPPSLI